MTEAGWINATWPQHMLEFMQHRVSERQLRLFGAACCRRVWGLIQDEKVQSAVTTAERYVDGRCGPYELQLTHRSGLRSEHVWTTPSMFAPADFAAAAARDVCHQMPF